MNPIWIPIVSLIGAIIGGSLVLIAYSLGYKHGSGR